MEVKDLDSYSGYLCPISHRIFICLFIYLCVIYSDSVRHSDCIASTGMMENCQTLHTTQIIVLNASRLIEMIILVGTLLFSETTLCLTCTHLCVSLKGTHLQSYTIYLVVLAVIQYFPSVSSSSLYP